MSIGPAHKIDNYLNGGATVYVKLDGETDYRDLGNIVGGTPQVNYDHDVLDHFSSRSGVRVRDRRVVTRQQLDINFTLDEINDAQIMKLLMNGGDITDSTQGALTNTTTTYTCQHDKFHSLGKRKISNVSIGSGSAAKVEGTDYEVDYDLGLIKILSGGSISDNSSVTVEYDVEALTTDERQVFTPLASKDVVSLDGVMFKILDGEGNFQVFTATQATLAPAGPLTVSDTEWSNLPMTISVLDGTMSHEIVKAS